jgi:hypothetical protein
MEHTIKSCSNCGEELTKIVFRHVMSEEWKLNGETWELEGRNSLIHDPQLEVRCPECDAVVGIGKDFGF